MNALEQADALQQQAIALLLAERQQIDDRLSQLGHGEIKTTLSKKRGRPAKLSQPSLQEMTHASSTLEH